jgi:hypothetical protein
VLLREGLTGEDGILVALSDFSDAAIAEAASLRIELVDGHKLAERLRDVGADELLRADTSHSPFPCPECGRSMIPALSPHGYWLQCPRYRSGCRGKRDLGRDPTRALELLIRSR